MSEPQKKIELLRGGNYNTWKHEMEVLLKVKGLVHTIRPAIPKMAPPEFGVREGTRWEQSYEQRLKLFALKREEEKAEELRHIQCDKAVGIMLNNMTQEVRLMYKTVEDPLELWTKLFDKYGKAPLEKNFLWNKLFKVRYGSCSNVAQYIAQLNMVIEQLRAVEQTVPDAFKL